MITVESVETYEDVTINCPCLKFDAKPMFHSYITSRKVINKKTFKTLNLISLASLIELVKNTDYSYLMLHYDLYFIVPSKHNYLVNRAFFLGDIRISE